MAFQANGAAAAAAAAVQPLVQVPAGTRSYKDAARESGDAEALQLFSHGSVSCAPPLAAEHLLPTIAAILTELCEVNDQSPSPVISKFHAARNPGISIIDYMRRVAQYADCSDTCFVLALIYIDRVQAHPNFQVCTLNVHRLIITSVMLAAKFFDDHYFNNAFYARIGGVSKEEMNQLELEYLFMISFTLTVSEREYTAYDTELRGHCQRLAERQQAAERQRLQLEEEQRRQAEQQRQMQLQAQYQQQLEEQRAHKALHAQQAHAQFAQTPHHHQHHHEQQQQQQHHHHHHPQQQPPHHQPHQPHQPHQQQLRYGHPEEQPRRSSEATPMAGAHWKSAAAGEADEYGSSAVACSPPPQYVRSGSHSNGSNLLVA